ncbi:MAG: 50S ribosomal protein L29 [Rhodoglobus sp.]|nr:50S ribosomal protein L29 [Rhodoglobus sp.]
MGSKELRPVELDTFEDERLVDELKKAKEELFNLRFQSATGQLESHGRIRAVKRDIARIYTVIRERELGIRATPAPLEAPVKAKAKRGTEPAEVKTTKKAEAADAAEATEETKEA